MPERSVGLVVLTDVPGMGFVAVLRERGRWNLEKDKPESWPGGCQVTAHGKLEDSEDFAAALRREVEEELGSDPAWQLFQGGVSSGSSELVEVTRIEGDKEVRTYAIRVPYDLLKKIRLEPGSGGLRFVKESEVGYIEDLRGFPKDAGVSDRRVVAMFTDEKEAVASAFAHFAKQS